MPKKKNRVTFEDDIVSNQINSKYGDIIESGSKVLASLEDFNVLGISPALDIALGGGIREGSCVVITGDPKTGKTTTALYFAAKAQKLGKKVYYFNTEGRLTKENFTGIKGLNVDEIKIVQATDNQPMVSAEKFLNALEAHVKGTPDLVAIVDSTSNMVPQDELDGEIRTGVRNALPRLLAMFLKRISNDVCRTKAILIFVTHNIANTGGSRWAPSKMADCGNMLQFQAGTNMVITHRGKWDATTDNGKDVGQVANWVIKTSAAGGIPNATATSWIRYGVGIDEVQEIAQIANEFALIKRSGAWYTLSTAIENKDDPTIKSWLLDNEIDPDSQEDIEKAFKYQGMERLTTFLENNETITNFVYDQIKEILL
jgi:recombination protein RecA